MTNEKKSTSLVPRIIVFFIYNNATPIYNLYCKLRESNSYVVYEKMIKLYLRLLCSFFFPTKKYFDFALDFSAPIVNAASYPRCASNRPFFKATSIQTESLLVHSFRAELLLNNSQGVSFDLQR